MKTKILSKLRQRAGESLTETLVALLIATFALMLLAGAISTTQRLVSQSEDAMSEYYTKNNAVALQSGGTDPATDTATVTISGDLSGDLSAAYGVKLYTNDQFSKTPVIAYHP